jgi:hypothetical protein
MNTSSPYEIANAQYNIKDTSCSRDSSVGIAKDYRPHGPDLFSAKAIDSSYSSVQNIPGAHPASYPLGGKAAMV